MKFPALFAVTAASTDLLADLLTLTKDLSTKVDVIKDESLREATKNWITDGFLLYSDRETSSIKEIKSAISGKNSSSLIFIKLLQRFFLNLIHKISITNRFFRFL